MKMEIANGKLLISHASGVRLFDDGIGVRSTDATESAALLHKIEMVDIYSNSWGPGDGGWQVAGPGVLTNQALQNGAKKVHVEYKLCVSTCLATKSNIIDIITTTTSTSFICTHTCINTILTLTQSNLTVRSHPLSNRTEQGRMNGGW